MEVSRNVLPDDQLFARLLQLATRKQDEVIVDDQSIGKQFGYRHIIHGTVKLSQKLQGLLDQSVLDNRGRFYVAVLAPNGYEFIIAVLAVLAIGGVVVPMPTGALPAEAAYIIQQCNARYLLVGPEQGDLATRIQEEVIIPSLTIEGQADDAMLLPTTAYTLETSLVVEEDCPSIVFFTSGTTGPPKGVLHARRTINKYARMELAGKNDDICLIPRGAFWSLYFTRVFQMLLTEIRIEIHNFGRNYNLIWEKFREQTGTRIVLSPTFWYGMMRYFQTHISQLPESVVQEYIQGAHYLREACAAGAMPSARVKKFWQDMRGGRSLRVLYGTTETQEISVCSEELGSTENDLGNPLPTVQVKLDGEEGELLVKTPSLFLGYLNLPEASEACFDSEGFFKTGDQVIRHNGRIFFEGRANMDLFKFYTYKVPRAQVEASLLALPYIVEGYILPVADPQCDTRVAALVRLDDGVEKVDLQTIRADLSKDLPAYQLPTVLRHLRNYESVPRTWSDKTAMRKAIQKFFPQDMEERLYEEEAEVMDISAFMKAQTTKLWDLSGIR